MPEAQGITEVSISPRVRRVIEIIVFAIFTVFLAGIVRGICHSVFNETIPYTPFYPAIILSTMYGRLMGGIVATIMAAFAASFWLPPFGQPLVQESTDLIGLFLFLLVSGVVVCLCEAMLRAQASAEIAMQEERLAAVRENAARIDAEEANRLKDQFLASASHELRTPLQAILGWAHLLMQSNISDEERAQGLEVIERNARVQSRLIEDLLDMTRIVAGKLQISPRDINLRQVIDAAAETVTTAAQAKQISIVCIYHDDDLTLWADPDRLQQVVWNLLSNSIKFSPPHSTIKVSLRRSSAGLELEVADQGEGIAPELLPYVFERFRQAVNTSPRRMGGLGLGLAIVKQLVELHGGEVHADSPGLGQGARFTITLPVAQNRQPFVRTKGDCRARRKLTGLRVLVVDDDASTCELIARVLRDQHSDVVAATSVEQAMQVMKGFKPDVIVSDIAMPERDGYQLLREVRARDSDGAAPIPAMALSALSGPEDRRRAFEAGYRIHLTKPVDASALTEAVAELAYN